MILANELAQDFTKVLSYKIECLYDILRKSEGWNGVSLCSSKPIIRNQGLLTVAICEIHVKAQPGLSPSSLCRHSLADSMAHCYTKSLQIVTFCSRSFPSANYYSTYVICWQIPPSPPRQPPCRFVS